MSLALLRMKLHAVDRMPSDRRDHASTKRGGRERVGGIAAPDVKAMDEVEARGGGNPDQQRRFLDWIEFVPPNVWDQCAGARGDLVSG